MVKRTGSVQMAFMVPEDVAKRLRALSDRTRVPQAVYFREGLEGVLKRYEARGKRPGTAKRGQD
jgi:predicted DNA-binding protein